MQCMHICMCVCTHAETEGDTGRHTHRDKETSSERKICVQTYLYKNRGGILSSVNPVSPLVKDTSTYAVAPRSPFPHRTSVEDATISTHQCRTQMQISQLYYQWLIVSSATLSWMGFFKIPFLSSLKVLPVQGCPSSLCMVSSAHNIQDRVCLKAPLPTFIWFLDKVYKASFVAKIHS